MQRLCIGSYNRLWGAGIHIFSYDSNHSKFDLLYKDKTSRNPSFLAMDQKHLYAVNEVGKNGKIDVFAWQDNYTALSCRGSLPVPGSAMCHIIQWPDQQHLSIANYMSGDFAVCTCTDGMPTDIATRICHKGVGFDSKGRQEKPHMHSTCLNPGADYLFAADLGLDLIVAHRVNTHFGGADEKPSMEIHLPQGSGPRHMCFSPDGHWLYVAAELNSSVYVYELEGMSHAVMRQCIAMNSEGKRNLTAHIALSPDGKYLYVSNRGLDNLRVFRVGENHLLTDCGCFATGRGPRHFCISDDGLHVAIACQQDNVVQVCPRDPQTGTIGSVLSKVPVKQPVYVQILSVQEECYE